MTDDREEHDVETYRYPDAIVETEALAASLGDPDLRVLDCTVHLVYDGAPPGMPYLVKSGREDYERAHIPGADFIDLQAELSEQDSPYSFTLPTALQFSAAMGRHGVGKGTRVVLYAGTHLMWATRVWWMLRAFGFDHAAVLNGGIGKWQAEGRPVSSGPPPVVAAAEFTASPRPALFTDKHEILAALGSSAVCTVNALSPDHYRGTNARYGRCGRIPGSVSLPAAQVFETATGTFKSAAELATTFASVCPSRKTDRIVVYCGGGIAATLDAFLLHQLGYQNVAVYDNSMSEWAKDDSLPLETG